MLKEVDDNLIDRAMVVLTLYIAFLVGILIDTFCLNVCLEDANKKKNGSIILKSYSYATIFGAGTSQPFWLGACIICCTTKCKRLIKRNYRSLPYEHSNFSLLYRLRIHHDQNNKVSHYQGYSRHFFWH